MGFEAVNLGPFAVCEMASMYTLYLSPDAAFRGERLGCKSI
jgi:hypothetical protein